MQNMFVMSGNAASWFFNRCVIICQMISLVNSQYITSRVFSNSPPCKLRFIDKLLQQNSSENLCLS